MRVLFWGTPAFAVPALDALLHSPHTVVGLVTQPDRPRGRTGGPQPPPTKTRLLESGHDAPILQPEKPAGDEFRARLAGLGPDVSVVAGYGRLLPGPLLELPRLGSLNLHASLLPRHRGAAPVAAAILAGDAVTGITLMRMDRGLDTGAILLQRAVEIAPGESCGELTERLGRLAAEVVLEGLAAAEEGRLHERPQNEEEATYAPRITPEAARIRWRDPAEAIERALRAYEPWPGAFTLWKGRRLKLFRGRVAHDVPAAPSGGTPGEVLTGPRPGLFVRAGDGTLEVLELQLESRPRLRAQEFLRGRRIEPGTRLE